MNTPKKIAQYVRTSLSSVGSLFSPDSPDITVEPVDSNPDMYGGDATVVIKRADYKEMQSELSGQADEIRHLRSHEEEYISKIQEYEALFTEVLRKELFDRRRMGDANNDREPDTLAMRSSYEKEIMRLKSMEDRLKSHINALERDLIAAEQAAEETEDGLRCEIFLQREALSDTVKRVEAVEIRNYQLMEENKRLREMLGSNSGESQK